MNKLKIRLFLGIEAIIAIVYTIVTIGFILDVNNIFLPFSKYATKIVVWQMGFELFGTRLYATTTIYYIALFGIPIIGHYYFQRHSLIHNFLVFAILSNLLSFLFFIFTPFSV